MALSKNIHRVVKLNSAYTPTTDHPVLTNTVGYLGAIMVTNAAGALAPATTATGLIAQGVLVQGNYDATGVSTGVIRRGVFTGDFECTISGSDPVTLANVGTDVFLVDDDVIAATNGSNTRSRAGKMVGMNAAGTKAIVRIGVGIGN